MKNISHFILKLISFVCTLLFTKQLIVEMKTRFLFEAHQVMEIKGITYVQKISMEIIVKYLLMFIMSAQIPIGIKVTQIY